MIGVTVYIYQNQIEARKQIFWCQRCNRAMFAYNANQIIIANVMGKRELIEPSQNWIEIECHSCRMPHRILFQ